ncbi:Hpt domain-containing protein [Sphingobium sufflavum]|uniref:Hpt domain-containing protein n=1 Tax=Sphingobium sufflavum TaxID=1129547 RepID=UPI001F2A7F3A|nr:Hpt domain-containing protein [Sphingobium sufflavum]MCE7796648.1 Hpt domain-containing protein [Sphingobium sufflavum]
MQAIRGSHAILLLADDILKAQFRQWLEPHGWVCDFRDTDEELRLSPDDAPAIVLMDAAIDGDRLAGHLAAIRATAGPAAGTPVLLLAPPGHAGVKGVSGRIDTPPDRERAIALIAHWTGPLDDHGFRDLSAPHYRLVRLAGQESAARLLLSFAGHAEAALARMDAGEDVKRAAHDLAGLAGTLGFGALSAAWSAIERDESDDPDAARAATRATIQSLKYLFSKE